MSRDRMELSGKKGLIVGIANSGSIAYGCASVLREAGAEIAVTFLNAKAEAYVRPLAEALDAPIVAPLDVAVPGQAEALFRTIADRWGRLDFVIHSIAYAPAGDLHGRVTDCSAEGFREAMDISCYSLIELTRLAEPLMGQGGAILTMSFYGGDKVVPQYNLMGPVKAALQAIARSLASELAPSGIRVHVLSPGPLRTRAASGIGEFDELLADAAARTPRRQLATARDVGQVAAFLISDSAQALTGNTTYIDGGRHIMA